MPETLVKLLDRMLKDPNAPLEITDPKDLFLPTYVASPYSDKNVQVQEARFEHVQREVRNLMMLGIPAISPIAYCHPIAVKHGLPTDYLFWKNFNDRLLDACPNIIFVQMEGLAKSKGVEYELRRALERRRDGQLNIIAVYSYGVLYRLPDDFGV